MNRFLYLVFCFFCALSFNAVVSPAFADGYGSWGDDSGFTGNGGSFGGGGVGGTWEQCLYVLSVDDSTYSTLAGACSAYKSIYSRDGTCEMSSSGIGIRFRSTSGVTTTIGGYGCEELPVPECPVDMHWDGSSCVKDLKCPAGYITQDNKCIWQCPAGYKMLGGNCVPEDMPEDCDPAIQQCDADGKPVCDCCANLKQLVSQNNTIINNDNRIISLTENMTTNQNTIITNTENINNNITQTNIKLDELINVIKQNNPDFDTTGIENKLDDLKQVLSDKEFNADNINIDMSETNGILNALIQAVKDNKYDDGALKLKLDEVIKAINDKTTDLTPITERQDEQTGLLAQIRDLLRPVEQAELAPQLEDVSIDAHLDPWSAIRGFDVNQNMINAQAQCPSGDAYSFNFLGFHHVMPMSVLCTFLGKIGVGIMFVAYMSAAFIIVKGD